MTVAPQIDVRDLGSVRRAAEQTERVVLGDDWVSPNPEEELEAGRRRRGLWTLNASPMARRIITFNLLALIVLVAGVLYMNPSRDNLAYQRAQSLVSEAELIASVFEARLAADAPDAADGLGGGDGLRPERVLEALVLRTGIEVQVYDTAGQRLAATSGAAASSESLVDGLAERGGRTILTDALSAAWSRLAAILDSAPRTANPAAPPRAREDVQSALGGATVVSAHETGEGLMYFTVATPILQREMPVGVIATTSVPGEIDALIRQEREQLLQMFLVGVAVSVALSLVLASTIANPLADLAAAAEIGRNRNARNVSPSRVRIPDLTARPDEIGRLSGALRGMVAALYDRIEGNEQFAADVAHEIKNPLASLRSAVGTLRSIKREDHREKLLDVIDHDVRRLDRLVSDISNASRLDSELVKEEEKPFDLVKMLSRLCEHLGREAGEKGVDFISDMPDEPIVIHGLEGRLAQVFVNLITNALSFCEEGDAIRIWARKRDSRVLVVVEDTGPGIPDSALTKIFKRFYSERPQHHFGNNSGLGLAISKQIVEAHGGVIWAENIRPTESDPTSEPLGARFVTGLPV